ncbi:hypothetical protein IGK47_004761 [Enterococcus sp. AZ007]
MFYSNSIGKVYMVKRKVVLESTDLKYSFESSNPTLVQATYNEYVNILMDIEMEEILFKFIDSDDL